jgi:glycosyltransferase involved in cell wall biosynthesis
MINIRILIDRIKPGGPSKIAINEVKWLNKFGYNPMLTVLMKGSGQGYLFDDLTCGIPIEFLSRKFPRPFRYSYKLPGFSFFSSHHLYSPVLAPQLISNRETSLFVAHETYTCFTAFEIYRRKKIPYIAYIHDTITYILPKVYQRNTSLKRFLPFLCAIGKCLDRLIVENSVVTLTNSMITLSRVKEVSDKKEVEVAYPGCEPLRTIPQKRGDYLLALTKWDIGKKPRMLLDVLEGIDNKIKLVVAGFWVQRQIKSDFVREVKKRNLSKRVEIVGPLPEDLVKELYAAARVLIHPIVEGFGMIALEAAAHGCPFIIPRGSGVTELFKHGVHGFFSEEGNVDEYIKYVDRLVSDERLAWNMGRDAWNIAKQYTWKVHSKKLEEAILRYVI